MSVTGRTYTTTRPRGFAPWSPRAASRELLGQVHDVLAEYRDQLPLTNRQIFYRLVGTVGYAKTEQAYGRLCEALSRARRAGLVDFGAIRDDGTTLYRAPGWHSPDSFWGAVRAAARDYRRHPAGGQPRHREVWVEASGMAPQAARVAAPYGADVYSAGGFNGLTDKYETAQRLAAQSRPVVILHVGDFDPSGCAIVDALADDVAAFTAALAPRLPVEFRRVAVTPAQVAQHGLPTAPQKVADRRGEHMDATVQAEALPPDVLAAELRAALDAVTDTGRLAAARELGAAERQQILGTLRALGPGDAT